MGGEQVILNLTTGVYYGLDDVAARVWSLLEEPCPISKILETIVSEYDVDAERCKADMLVLLADLSKAQLIEVKSA